MAYAVSRQARHLAPCPSGHVTDFRRYKAHMHDALPRSPQRVFPGWVLTIIMPHTLSARAGRLCYACDPAPGSYGGLRLRRLSILNIVCFRKHVSTGQMSTSAQSCGCCICCRLQILSQLDMHPAAKTAFELEKLTTLSVGRDTASIVGNNDKPMREASLNVDADIFD